MAKRGVLKYELSGVMVVCTAATCKYTYPLLGRELAGPSALLCHCSVVRASTSGCPL